jgi:hypothetical protein
MNFEILLALLFTTVAAVSESFTLDICTKESALDGYNIYADDSNIFVGNSPYVLNGTIKDNGALKLANQSFVGISKNYLTLTNDTTKYAQPFSIDKDGYLNLYGSKDFKVIPSGSENSQWILASNHATDTVSGTYTVQIKATGADGKKVSQFSISGSGVSKPSVSTAVLLAFFVLMVHELS